MIKLLLELLVRLLASLLRAPAPKPPPGKPVPAAKPMWFNFAEREIGFHERGENRGIERYIHDAKCGEEGDPWCAIFVNAMLERAGVRGTRSAMARSFEQSQHFVKLDGPALGAITTMWRKSPRSGLGHVFFYAGENAKGVYALGGNQDDQVCLQYEPRNRIVGYWWPKSQPLPKHIGPVSVRAAGTMTSKEV